MKDNLILIALVIAEGAWASDRLTIGTVTEESGDATGGCSLQLPHEFANRGGKKVFVSDFEGGAIINVDGADVHLRLVKSKGLDVKQRGQLSDHSHYSYAGGGVEVEVDYVVTGGCPAGNDACKVTRYDAILTVKRGKMHKTVAGKGVCET